MNVMSMQQYPSPYGAYGQMGGQQQGISKTPQGQVQPGTPTQQLQRITKFYKSGLLWMSSAVGNMMRDHEKMQAQGWQLTHYAFLGSTALFLRRVIAATYERPSY
jgi:hypothetical protein